VFFIFRCLLLWIIASASLSHILLLVTLAPLISLLLVLVYCRIHNGKSKMPFIMLLLLINNPNMLCSVDSSRQLRNWFFSLNSRTLIRSVVVLKKMKIHDSFKESGLIQREHNSFLSFWNLFSQGIKLLSAFHFQIWLLKVKIFVYLLFFSCFNFSIGLVCFKMMGIGKLKGYCFILSHWNWNTHLMKFCFLDWLVWNKIE
jgi:hypothetical protein